MSYILLSVIFYAMLFNVSTIILITSYRPVQRPISRQIAQVERIVLNDTQCRACNVLLVDHNHGCNWSDLKQVPIEPDVMSDVMPDTEPIVLSLPGEINKSEDVTTMNDTELLAHYNEILNEIKQRPELAHILEPKKRTRKTVQDAAILEDWLQDSFPGYKSGRNKLGGGNCKVSTFTLKQANIDRINARFLETWGTMPEREMLISKCPKCNGHFRTSFERDMSLIEEDKEYQGRIIHKLITRYTCDDCGHVEIDSKGENGKYLCDKGFDMVAKYAGTITAEPVTTPDVEDIEDTIDNALLECPGCKQEFGADELDNGGCPFCGCPLTVTV